MRLSSLLLLFITPAAYAFSLDDIVSWTGTGTNRAGLVVDFRDGRGALAWGFRFDEFNEANTPGGGTFRGIDMIGAIATATELDVQITSYSFGDAITGLRWRDRSRGGFDPSSTGYFGYLIANGTANEPTWGSANESTVGASDRFLTDGSWDAWSWYPNFLPEYPCGTTPAPVPEPASLSALGLGLLATRVRSRRCRRSR